MPKQHEHVMGDEGRFNMGDQRLTGLQESVG